MGRHGVGTERLEAEVASLVPGIELMRLDSDIASSYARLRAVLDRFAAPGAKVLVGTQMIAKGHHFPEVTLVGVINADLSLYFPDFRAEERTYSMLMQVGGRAGRGEHPGRVLVQTLNPEARPIAMAAAGEHEQFYAGELERRRQLGYPPATTLMAWRRRRRTLAPPEGRRPIWRMQCGRRSEAGKRSSAPAPCAGHAIATRVASWLRLQRQGKPSLRSQASSPGSGRD